MTLALLGYRVVTIINEMCLLVNTNRRNFIKGKLVKNKRNPQVSESHPDNLFHEISLRDIPYVCYYNKGKVKRFLLARNSLLPMPIYLKSTAPWTATAPNRRCVPFTILQCSLHQHCCLYTTDVRRESRKADASS